jgi:hypothetical protein
VFRDAQRGELSNTEFLAGSMLGLPFYVGMGVEVIEKIVETTAAMVKRKNTLQAS